MELELPSNQELTHCTVCEALFLGPTILPCGHVVCRRCVRILLSTDSEGPACPFCRRHVPVGQGQTISELANQLDRDVVLEEAVLRELRRLGPVPCVACSSKDATKVCLDCGDMYCYNCSSAHRGMNMSRDHAQQDIQSSSSSLFLFGTWTGSASTAREVQERQSQYYKHKDYLRMEASLFRKVMAEMRDTLNQLDVHMDKLQEVKTSLEHQHLLLTMYVTRLDRSDDVMVANMQTMLPRLKRVRKECHPPRQSALKELAACIDNLLQPDTASDDVTGDDGITFDPMTSVPLKVFSTTPEAAGDTEESSPWIRALATTHDARLVMTDWNNKKVKVTELADPYTTSFSVTLDARPHSLTLLSGDEVAVTSDRKCIYYVSIDDHPRVVSHVPTARQYRGVCSVDDDDTMVVSCRRDKDGPPSVDVITRTGVLLKTLTNGRAFPDLSHPTHLYLHKREVLVSDFGAQAVFRLDLGTGRVLGTISHPELREPHQVAVDKDGNCYITSDGGQCVLVATPGGVWRRLLHGPEHGETTCLYPMGLCVTCSGIVVTWDDPSGPSIVSGYDLT